MMRNNALYRGLPEQPLP